MRAWRIGLWALGAVLATVGGLALTQSLRPAQLTGLVVWLAVALILHDGILVPAISVANAVVGRVGRRVPRSAIVVIEVGFVVGALLSLAAFPELVAQRLGARNPTVVPLDYAANLGWLWLGVAVTVAVGVTITVRRARRTAASPPTTTT